MLKLKFYTTDGYNVRRIIVCV